MEYSGYGVRSLKLIFLLLILSANISAQVADFLPTQKTVSKPFSLPIKIDLDGKIDYVVGDRNLVFAPGLQFAWDKNFIQYSIPELASEFSLQPPKPTTGWMEFKRKRYEYGAGLHAILQKTFRLGIAPYKGASLTMRRLKIDKDALTSDDILMPKKLSEIEEWSESDEGTFQAYGGIQIFAGINFSVVTLIQGTLAWQNQFIVSIQRKLHGINLTIKEERLDRQSVFSGMELVNARWTHFKGKQFHANFELDFDNPRHHELYEIALKGDLTKLEEEIPESKKQMSWVGSDYTAYWGIPFLFSKTSSRGSYVVSDEQQDYSLEVIQSKKAGILVASANNQKFVYHNSESILLMWTTDMNKSAPKTLKKHFFAPAQAVGFKGFDIVLDDRDYGTVIGEVGVVITKDDTEKFLGVSQDIIARDLKIRCQALRLDCAETPKHAKVMKNYLLEMKKKWSEKKKGLGLLLVREPALLHVLLKNTGLNKEAYFKFLSDRFQSLEGLTKLVF